MKINKKTNILNVLISELAQNIRFLFVLLFFFRYSSILNTCKHPIKNLSLFLIVLLFGFCINIHAVQENKKMKQLYSRMSSEQSESLFKQGNKFLENDKLDEAMVCYTIVSSRYSPNMSDEEKQLCAKALNNAGGISQIRSSFSTAFSYYKKAIQIAKAPIYQTYNNIAGVYLFFEDYENARKYLTQAYDIGLQQKDYHSLCNSLQNIILLDWCVDSIDDAVNRINKFLKIKEVSNDSNYKHVVEKCKGVLAYKSGNYNSAITFFKRCIALGNDKESNNTPYLYIARCYMKMKNYQKAIDCLRTSERNAREMRFIDHLIMDYQYQIQCYAMMGDSMALRDAKYKYLLLKDSINSAEEFGKIKNIEFFHEVDRYEKQVIQLHEEQKNTRIVITIVSIALAVVALLLWLATHRNKKLKERNKELFYKHNELIKQAGIERQQRKAYSDKMSFYESKIEELQNKISTMNSASGKMISETNNAKNAEESTSTTESRNKESQPDTGYKSSLTESQSNIILEKIYLQMDDTEFICQQDLTIEQLAQSIGTNEKYTSQVINELLGKNFNTLLNEYRIHEGCRRLVDFEHYGNMTNEAIAEGLGFKSRSHFIRTFKKITGLTPSQYQKIALQENN